MARGRKAVAIDDRSGFKVPYRKLKTQWDGLRTSGEDFDTRHPQLDPPPTRSEGLPLPGARPDRDQTAGEINFTSTAPPRAFVDSYNPADHSPADEFKIALYTSAAPIARTTEEYTTSGEISGDGYTQGGSPLTLGSPRTIANSDYYPATATFSAATFVSNKALVYNTTNDKAVLYIEFPFDVSTYRGNLTFIWPANKPRDAALRIDNA